MSGKRFILSVLIAASSLLGLQACNNTTPDANASAAAGALAHHGVEAEDLAITRVVLYQNGVGYFEREGTVEGDAITLRIRPDQINDILKSLTVIDKGSGRAISISLPVDRQAVDRLAQLPPQIRNEGGVLSLLQAFRGARVELNTDRGVLVGRIVGTERNEKLDKEGHAMNGWRVTIKEDDGELQILDLDAIQSLELEDQTLALGLEKSLDISLNEGAWKPIELKVRMSDAETRDVRLSYIVEMPVWKPAYRMVLGEQEEGLVQGWAVVDNVSGSDWNNVEMSLVAGTPISFVYDLYEPHFVSRPDLTHRRHYSALAPPTLESAVSEAPRAAPAPPMGGKLRKSRDKDARGWDDATMPEEPMEEAFGYAGAELEGRADNSRNLAAYEKNFVSNTEGAQMGALFRYDVGSRVSVPDSSSSLVNIVDSKGLAREVVLFPQDRLYGNVSGVHPFSAAQFENASGFDLEPGPITIYRADGTFVGEGFLPRTEQEKVAFVTFALDSRVTARTESQETEEASRLVKLHGGVLHSEVKRVRTVTYELKNIHDKAVTAIVQRPIVGGWALEGLPEGALEASGSHYIPVEVPAGESVSLEIREVTPVKRQLYFNDALTFKMLEMSLAQGDIPEEHKETIQEILEKRTRIGDIDTELADLSRTRDTLQDDSRRLSYTLSELKDIKAGRAKKLRAELVQKISEHEAKIGTLTTRLAELELERGDLDRTVRALFSTLSLEKEQG